MAMAIPAGHLRSVPVHARFDGLRAFWLAFHERRATRAALRRAGRLGPRLLADMGIDAETVRAISDDWDGLPVNGLLVHGRR